jgi:hypothetical protein
MKDDTNDRLKQFAAQHGASFLLVDEDLMLEKEIREEVAFWGSVYGSEFVEMPDAAFTSEPAYRTWCWKTTGIMPKKRNSTRDFDEYIRSKMLQATTREVLPGMEYGAEVDDAIERSLELYLGTAMSRKDGPWYQPGDWVWLEDLDEGYGEEIIIRINPLLRQVNKREAIGHTQGKIKRRDVVKRLMHYGRKVGDRDASMNRLRSSYALPKEFLEGGFEALINKVHKGTGGEG